MGNDVKFPLAKTMRENMAVSSRKKDESDHDDIRLIMNHLVENLVFDILTRSSVEVDLVDVCKYRPSIKVANTVIGRLKDAGYDAMIITRVHTTRGETATLFIMHLKGKDQSHIPDGTTCLGGTGSIDEDMRYLL